MEEQPAFRMEGDGLGHFEVRGTAEDQPGIGNRLSWTLEIDQAQLFSMIDDVQAITGSLPVRGV